MKLKVKLSIFLFYNLFNVFLMKLKSKTRPGFSELPHSKSAALISVSSKWLISILLSSTFSKLSASWFRSSMVTLYLFLKIVHFSNLNIILKNSWILSLHRTENLSSFIYYTKINVPIKICWLISKSLRPHRVKLGHI